MRRRIKPSAVAFGTQHGFQGGGHRPLAVGSGDMDGRPLILRVPKRREDFPNPVQARMNAEHPARVQVLKKTLVAHFTPAAKYDRISARKGFKSFRSTIRSSI